MSTSTKTDAADRHHGGPGSSHVLMCGDSFAVQRSC
jgi:hypothetical protein